MAVASPATWAACLPFLIRVGVHSIKNSVVLQHCHLYLRVADQKSQTADTSCLQPLNTSSGATRCNSSKDVSCHAHSNASNITKHTHACRWRACAS
eukprot:scaffold68564_cov18-Tisochrysis_lutea.AAC.1